MIVRSRALGVALLLSLLVTACGGGSGNGSGTASNGGSGGGGGGGGGEADRSATLRVAHATTPTQWDPHNGTSAIVDYSTLGPVYDRLLLIEPDQSVGPMLAESWDMAPDNMSMTMELRDDVTFHDGEPFNAEAVKANIDYTKEQDSFYADVAQIIDEVIVVDEHSVELTFTEDGTDVPLILAFYIGVGGMASPAALEDPATLATTPAGSGPYQLENHAQDRAVFTRVDGYWDETIDARAPERLEIIGIPDDNARISALQSGQIDASVIINPLANLEQITAGGDITLNEFPNNRLLHLNINYEDEALADPRVRQALSLAIDREAIAENIMQGACVPSAQAASEESIGYSDEAEVVFDPDAARDLLAEAGVEDLSFSMETVAIPAFENISTALQAQWADIGVDVSITPVVSAEAQGEWRSGGYELFMGSASGYPDPGPLFEDWVIGTNQPFGHDEDLAALHQAARVLPLGSEERDQAYAEANAHLAEHASIIVVCTWPVQTLSSSRVGGVEDVAVGRLQTAWDTRNLYVVAE